MSVDIDVLTKQAEADGIQKYVVGAYIMQDDTLLLLKRAPGEDFLPDLVELPSGGVDPGENLLQGLEREIIEETGLTITSVDRYINFFDYTSGSGKKARQFNFAVTVATPFEIKLNPAEHVAYYWVVPTADNLDGHFNLSDKTRKTIIQASDVLLDQAA
ncbi:MAG TPA: NUDIX hydrolase [Alphaproteobacteria bacterium]